MATTAPAELGTGSYLASRAENQLFRAEIAAEEAEHKLHPNENSRSSSCS